MYKVLISVDKRVQHCSYSLYSTAVTIQLQKASLVPRRPREDYAKGVWYLTSIFLGPEVIIRQEFVASILVGQKAKCYIMQTAN